MIIAHLHFWIIWGSWALFLLFWLIMGFSAKRNIHTQPANERRRYTLPLIAGVLLMGLSAMRHPPSWLDWMTAPLYPRTQPLMIVADVLAVLGVLVAIWARVTLGRNWSGVVTFKEGHELVTNGIYGVVRHPIYTALALLFGGMVIAIDSVAGFVGYALIMWSCWVKLRQEEALMIGQFPDRYPPYMARTKRLFPGII